MAGIRKREWTTGKGIKKSCYEITYYLNGKQYRKAGYRTKLKAQADLNKVTKSYSSNIKISELAQMFINNHCKLQCKPSTVDLYNTYLKTRLKDVADIRAKDLQKHDIERLVLEWKRSGAKNKTINNVLIFLQSVYAYGVEAELLSSNPVQKFKKLPRTKKPIQFLSDNEIPLFLEIAQRLTPEYYALFYTAIHTGMRRGELLALEWSDIDFRAGKISVNKQMYRNQLTTPKTLNSIRLVDMSEELAEVLREHKKEQKVLSKLVFCTKEGRYIHPYNMSVRYFKAVLKELSEQLPYDNNVEALRFHDLRHTYATYLLSKGIPVKYVQEQLGHSSAKITLDTYIHVMPNTKNQAFEVWKNIKSEQNMSIKK